MKCRTWVEFAQPRLDLMVNAGTLIRQSAENASGFVLGVVGATVPLWITVILLGVLVWLASIAVAYFIGATCGASLRQAGSKTEVQPSEIPTPHRGQEAARRTAGRRKRQGGKK